LYPTAICADPYHSLDSVMIEALCILFILAKALLILSDDR